MTHHVWGDAWFEKYGNQLNEAIHWCMSEWKRRARLGSHGKEKFGIFRHHPCFYSPEWSIHSLAYPGYVYYQWSTRLMILEGYLGKLVSLLRIDLLIIKYQRRVYRQVLLEACEKWPEIREELMNDYQKD